MKQLILLINFLLLQELAVAGGARSTDGVHLIGLIWFLPAIGAVLLFINTAFKKKLINILVLLLSGLNILFILWVSSVLAAGGGKYAYSLFTHLSSAFPILISFLLAMLSAQKLLEDKKE